MLPIDGEKVLKAVTDDLVRLLSDPQHTRTLDQIVDILVKEHSWGRQDVYYSLSRLDVYQDSDGYLTI